MHKKTAKKLLKKVKQDYSQISDEFDKTRQTNWKEFEIFLPYIKNSQKVADLGCGNGRLYKFLKKHTKINYIGIDNSAQLLNKAKKAFPKAKFINANLTLLPNIKVDLCLAIASLHHIPSKPLRQKAIKQFHKILKKNGTLIITVWNLFQPKYKKYIWKSRIRHILSLGKYDARDTFIPWGKTKVKRYYYAFKPKELRKLLQNKFEILKEEKSNNFTLICRKK
ncbi:MAG: class I SAM-dependent methyltransferase [Candidatus Peregrinibacteria bacterium]